MFIHRSQAALAALALALAPGTARSDEARTDAPLVLEPGATLRVTAAPGVSVGTLQGLSDAGLLLEGQGPVPLAAVQQLEVRERSLGRGAAIGAGVGALAGVLTVTGLYASGDSEHGTGDRLIWGSAFGLAGAALGTAVGSVIGYFAPRWRPLWARGEQGAPPALVLREPTRLGQENARLEVELAPGYAARRGGLAGGTGGFGLRGHALLPVASALAVGVEAAGYSLREYAPPPRFQPEGRDFLAQAGLLARAGPQAGELRPALLLGVGSSWNRIGMFLGGSLGGALELQPRGSPVSVGLTLRYHGSFQAQELALASGTVSSTPTHYTMDAGVRWAW